MFGLLFPSKTRLLRWTRSVRIDKCTFQCNSSQFQVTKDHLEARKWLWDWIKQWIAHFEEVHTPFWASKLREFQEGSYNPAKDEPTWYEGVVQPCCMWELHTESE